MELEVAHRDERQIVSVMGGLGAKLFRRTWTHREAEGRTRKHKGKHTSARKGTRPYASLPHTTGSLLGIINITFLSTGVKLHFIDYNVLIRH